MEKQTTRRTPFAASRLAIGLLLLAPLGAWADIPPAPQPPVPIPTPVPTQQQYSILYNDTLSEALLGSVAFQKSAKITIANSTGVCTAQQKSWASGAQALVCNSTSSCLATVPACVMTVVDQSGLSPTDFIAILSVNSLSAGIPGPNPEP